PPPRPHLRPPYRHRQPHVISTTSRRSKVLHPRAPAPPRQTGPPCPWYSGSPIRLWSVSMYSRRPPETRALDEAYLRRMGRLIHSAIKEWRNYRRAAATGVLNRPDHRRDVEGLRLGFDVVEVRRGAYFASAPTGPWSGLRGARCSQHRPFDRGADR